MGRKKSLEDYIEAAKANLEAWNQHAIYWRTHKSELAKRRMELRRYDYLRAFSMIGMLSGGFEDRNIVDIGCAGGTEMEFLFLKNCRSLVGVDISRDMLKIFRDKIQNRSERRKVFLVMASAEYLPLRSGVFDEATVFHTLHHCPRPPKVIEEMVRVSKEIILLEPNRESVIHKIVHLLRSLRKSTFSVTKFPESVIEFHASGFSAKEIMNQLANLGVQRTYASTTGILPTWFPLPRLIAQTLLSLEELIQKMPILKWQLGSVLIVATRPCISAKL